MVAKRREERTLWRGKPLPDGYETDLNRIVDEVFDEAYRRDWTWTDLARFAGVSHYTVWRLGERKTKAPSYVTVWKLAKAVQFRVTFERLRPSVTKDRQPKLRTAKSA